MLKKFSSAKIVAILAETIRNSGVCLSFHRGRPCEVKKEEIVAFLLYSRMYGHGYEEMELDSELYLGRHYDHSNFHYHYKQLSASLIARLTSLFREKIEALLQFSIFLHIFDSTAISTSVREERTRQGLRKKEKMTEKFHTLLGYDPPRRFVVVEGMLATDHHTSDSQGAIQLLPQCPQGIVFGDSAYETYQLTEEAQQKGLTSVFKPTKKPIRKKFSAKAKARKIWKGNPSRLYKEIRGVGEVLYGAATRAGLIHTESRLIPNRQKDSLIIGLRQNVLTYLRLKALIRIIRKTRSVLC